MSQNSAYGHFEGQGQDHLGHMTPHWTHLMIVDGGLQKGSKFFFYKIATSLQVIELWPNMFPKVKVTSVT